MRSVVAVVLLAVAFAASAADVQEDPLERQMLSIAQELRCTVCQNQPISESEADLARDMRQIIREQLAAGKSRQEIIDYFVARYGDYVLMKPPYEGPGTLVWIGPLLLLGALAVSAFVYLRRRLNVSVEAPPKLSAEDAARVREAKKQLLE